MTTDTVRKKWGTIFMGERESTVEQLDAMQEPMRREKFKKEQQEDYLERVRARATERAREILGEAYAERQKVLDEAKAEASAILEKATSEARELKAQGQAAHDEGAAELDRSRAIREEAENIRNAAHDEGFHAGMEQAGEELKEFRAELGSSVANLLRCIAEQSQSVTRDWRDSLAELVRTAVEAGTGLVLNERHAAILNTLLFQSLQMLEEKASVRVRVNPEDEATVSDMLLAAHERVPELQQWIVSGDESIEAGGLVVESSAGSVECRREYYREMVSGIMAHLALASQDELDQAAVHAVVEQEAEKISKLAPKPEPAPEMPAEAGTAEADPIDTAAEVSEQPSDDELEAFAAAAALEPDDTPPASPPDELAAEALATVEAVEQTAVPPVDGVKATVPEMPGDSVGQDDPSSMSQESAPQAEPVTPAGISDEQSPEAMGETTMQGNGAEADLAWLPPLDVPEGVEARPGSSVDVDPAGYAGTAAAALFDNEPASNANPSLEELEEELFPVDRQEAGEDVLSTGGFLAGEKQS